MRRSLAVAFGAKRTCMIVWLRPPRSRLTLSRHPVWTEMRQCGDLAAVGSLGRFTALPPAPPGQACSQPRRIPCALFSFLEAVHAGECDFEDNKRGAAQPLWRGI